MSQVIIANANTNSIGGSIVNVSVEKLTCNLLIEKNKYGDTLPIIPETARVRGEKNVMYQLKIRAELFDSHNGQIVSTHNLHVRSNRASDKLIFCGKTDKNGIMPVTLETYDRGIVELDISTSGVTSAPLKIILKDAWYEALFLITGYHVCHEVDFSGPLVPANGLNEKHKDDFLFGAQGVPMQGTGLDTQGRFIRLVRMGGRWLLNSRGHMDRVSSPEDTKFGYAEGIVGRYSTLQEEHSIAIDPNIIPPRARVEIDKVGTRWADDTGSKIKLYHVDNFLGAGKSVVTAWLKAGINGTYRKIKYIGG